MAATSLPITIRQRTAPDGTTGWQAVTLAAVVTTHTIGLRNTADDVVAIVRRMMDLGMMDPAPIVVAQ